MCIRGLVGKLTNSKKRCCLERKLLMLIYSISGAFTNHVWLKECQYCVIIFSYKIPWTWSISWSWKTYQAAGQIHRVPNNGIIYSQIRVSKLFVRYPCRLNIVCFSWIGYSGDGLCGTRWNRWNLTAPARWMGVSNRWAHIAGHATYATGWQWLQAQAACIRHHLRCFQVPWPQQSPLALHTAAL